MSASTEPEQPAFPGYSPPSAPEDGADKAREGGAENKWKISSVRWDDTLVNRLLSSIRANPEWASSIARGALTSIDPGISVLKNSKASMSKTDAIREVTKALFDADPDYDMDDPAVQKSLLVSVRNKLYKLQPLDELLAKSDAIYSSLSAARKETIESMSDGPSVRRSMRLPLPRKSLAEDLESDGSSSHASPRPAAGTGGRRGTPSRGAALALRGGVPRHAPAAPYVRRPWRPPLPLRPQFAAHYPALTGLRTVADIRRAYYQNERSYLSASLERLTREQAERARLDEEHVRLLRAEIEQREKERGENERRFEGKANKLREKIAAVDEEIRRNEKPPPAPGASASAALGPTPPSGSGSAAAQIPTPTPTQNGFSQQQRAAGDI